MYTPKIYQNPDTVELVEFIKENSFAILICQQDNKPIATHIPLELEINEQGQKRLLGHISKANPQWKIFNSDQKFLAIFSSSHAYVSSSWYGHENVPTWNYIAVHAYGKSRILSEEELYDALKKLVDRYEAGRTGRVSMDTFSEQFLKRELRGIVGFEILIEELEASYKLSQNRNETDFKNIITQLKKSGDAQQAAVADDMERIRKTNAEK